jgi:hypothetical protein
MILLLTACASEQKLVTEVRTETVNVPVPVQCVEKGSAPKSRFPVDGTLDQNAAAASLELREWRRFGAAVVKQCSVN